MPDIDIDFANRDLALNKLEHVKAMRLADNSPVAHATGIYAHRIPYDPVNNIAGIDYKTAEDRGYFKIDFLNVGVYEHVRDDAHLIKLMETEPLWDLLQDDSFTSLLFHINGYGDLLRKQKPTSILELAVCLALIRPGKRHLQDMTKIDIMEQIWEKPATGEYHFKKSHAVAYATAIVVQINQICESVSYGYS